MVFNFSNLEHPQIDRKVNNAKDGDEGREATGDGGENEDDDGGEATGRVTAVHCVQIGLWCKLLSGTLNGSEWFNVPEIKGDIGAERVGGLTSFFTICNMD